MPWHYRLFRTCYVMPGKAAIEEHFTIREACYDSENRLIGISATGVAVGGTTRTELLKDHARMHEAFARPVLTPADIRGYVYGPSEVPLEPTPHEEGDEHGTATVDDHPGRPLGVPRQYFSPRDRADLALP